MTEYSRFLDSSGTHLTYTAISLFRNFNEGLSEKEKQFLKHHLDACPACSKKLQEVEEVEQDAPSVVKMRSHWLSTTPLGYSIAAVLLLAVGVSVFYYWNTGGREQPDSSRPLNQSIAAEPTNPERFASNPTLESFVGRTARSKPGVHLLAPGIGDTIAVPFTFRWEGGKQNEEYTVVVIDNKNNEQWRETTRASSLVFADTLQSGLYYVKLEANGVLAHVGKFVVTPRPH